MHGHVLPDRRRSYDQENQSLKKIVIQLKKVNNDRNVTSETMFYPKDRHVNVNRLRELV